MNDTLTPPPTHDALTPPPTQAALTPPPALSVVIPARNCKEDLRHCLNNLQGSSYRDFEVIVVDDASTDDTSAGIDAAKARVLVLPAQSGPGVARNRGAQIARGEFLLFLDADVCVNSETLGKVVETFQQDAAVTAMFGSYCTQPQARNVLSQYRNLMHHFVHQEGNEEASTFWSGCGAIRRAAFLEIGGFNPAYRRPSIEDVELGVRLRAAGHRIRLNKEVIVTHLKRWTLWGIVKTDVRDRAFPWTQLILRERNLPNDLNLGLAHRVSALLACGLVLAFLVGSLVTPMMLILPHFLVLGIVCLDSWTARYRVPTSFRVLTVLGVLAIAVWATFRFQWLSLIPFGLLAGIVLLNWRFYAFLARRRVPLFALLGLALQILYYVYSLFVFAFVMALHTVRPGATGKRPALETLRDESVPIQYDTPHADESLRAMSSPQAVLKT